MLDRREFGWGLAALGGASLLPLATAAAADDQRPAVSDAARALMRRSVVIDCNIAPPIGKLPSAPDRLAAARASGVTAVKPTIGGFNADFENTVADIAEYQRAIEMHPDTYLQVRQVTDIALAKRTGRVGIIFSFEGIEMLGGKVERIELFRNLGVRVMQLSYNTVSPFGAGVMSPPQAGLTDLGRQAIAKMNELGVALDLSHANPMTTSAAIKASKKPVLITHAGCAAVHAHLRNKTDAQLRELADKGGVLGIYDLFYLAPSPKQPTVEDYINHVAHALKLCGEDHVGIGSDTDFLGFDTSAESLADWDKALEDRRKAGVSAPEEDRPPYVIGLNSARRYEVIADALLRRGYAPRVAEKVLGANFMRAFGEIW